MPGVAGSAVLFLLVGSRRMPISPNHPERYMVHVQHCELLTARVVHAQAAIKIELCKLLASK